METHFVFRVRVARHWVKTFWPNNGGCLTSVDGRDAEAFTKIVATQCANELGGEVKRFKVTYEEMDIGDDLEEED